MLWNKPFYVAAQRGYKQRKRSQEKGANFELKLKTGLHDYCLNYLNK